MSQAIFYPWLNKFSEGNEQFEDYIRSGASKSAHKKENIEEVHILVVMQDRRNICEDDIWSCWY